MSIENEKYSNISSYNDEYRLSDIVNCKYEALFFESNTNLEKKISKKHLWSTTRNSFHEEVAQAWDLMKYGSKLLVNDFKDYKGTLEKLKPSNLRKRFFGSINGKGTSWKTMRKAYSDAYTNKEHRADRKKNRIKTYEKFRKEFGFSPAKAKSLTLISPAYMDCYSKKLMSAVVGINIGGIPKKDMEGIIECFDLDKKTVVKFNNFGKFINTPPNLVQVGITFLAVGSGLEYLGVDAQNFVSQGVLTYGVARSTEFLVGLYQEAKFGEYAISPTMYLTPTGAATGILIKTPEIIDYFKSKTK